MPGADQLEYNALVMGKGTDYRILRIEGLDMPPIRVEKDAKSIEHGSFVYSRFLEDRVIILHGMLHNEASRHSLIAELRATFVPQVINLPLSVLFDGESEEKLVYCKPTRPPTFMHTAGFKKGRLEWVAELTAEDPRMYSPTVSDLVGAGAAVNDGNFPTWPTLVIQGAYTDPVISNTTVGRSISLTGSGSGGDVLEIDFAARTIEKNGASVYSQLDDTAEWWDLKAGSNDITYSGVTGTATLSWRSAWI